MRRPKAEAPIHDVTLTVPDLDSYPDSAFIGSDVMKAVFQIKGPATLWKWVQAGRLPKPVNLTGSRRRSWNVGQIRRLIAEASQGGAV